MDYSSELHPLNMNYPKSLLITGVILLLSCTQLKAQSERSDTSRAWTSCYFPPEPSFPGGNAAMYRYLKNTIRSRKSPGRKRVITSFTIGEDGSISDCKILRGLNKKTDKRILKSLRNMPDWVFPGVDKRRTTYTLPLLFEEGKLKTPE